MPKQQAGREVGHAWREMTYSNNLLQFHAKQKENLLGHTQNQEELGKDISNQRIEC